MGYSQPLIFFVLAAFPFMFISPSHSSLDHENSKNLLPPIHVDNVNLSLYYETLCPGCAYFITNDLRKVFQTDLFTIVNLRFVPWGNAKIVDHVVRCQHGEDECYLNAIHSCVIDLWPDVETHFEFIHCTEEQTLEGPVSGKEVIWKNCSDKLGLRADLINKCYSSGIGMKLLRRHGNETARLIPPHEYVPWVVVNNKALRDKYEDFVKYVCDAYQGDPKPEACTTQSSSVGSANKKIATEIHPGGCYAGQT